MKTQTLSRTIKLPHFGIVITTRGVLPNGLPAFGEISSELKTHSDNKQSTDSAYDAAIDGLESLILAQAMAGIDITTPIYAQAVEVAAASIAETFGDL